MALCNQSVYLVQQFRHFRNLVDNHQSVFWLVVQHLIQKYRSATETRFDLRIEQINIDGMGELLAQQSGFSRLTCSKQKYATVQFVDNLQFTFYHTHFIFTFRLLIFL